MTKEVYLKFGERNKHLTFSLEENLSEWVCLRKEIKEASKDDADLHRRLQNCEIIFQKVKTKKSGDKITVDVKESTDNIEDEEELTVIFNPCVPTTSQSQPNLTSTPADATDSLFSFPVSSIPFNLEENIFSTFDLTVKDSDELSLNESSSMQVLFSPSEASLVSTSEKSNQVLEPDESEPSNKKTKSSKKSSLKDSLSKKKTANHFQRDAAKILPALSDTLQTACDSGCALQMYSAIMAFYGEYIRTETKDEPTKNDYNLLGEAIVKKHPEFASTTHPRAHGAVCKSLSNYVRNHKIYSRKALQKARSKASGSPLTDQSKNVVVGALPLGPSTTSTNHTAENVMSNDRSTDPVIESDTAPTFQSENIQNKGPPSTPKDKDKSKSSVGASDELVLAESAYNTMYKELQRVAQHGLTNNVKKLLQQTFQHRKTWLKGAGFQGVASVIEKFPFLKHHDLMLNELSLRVGKTISSLKEALHNCLVQTGKFLNLKYTTEQEKWELLLHLFKNLKPRNTSKNAADVLMIVESCNPVTKELDTSEEDGPRLVFFVQDGQVVSAFIVADASVEVKISNPNVEECWLNLLASYHAWDSTFPTAYKSVLGFFDEEVCGCRLLSQSIEYKKFKKSYSDWLKAKK